MNEKTLKLGDVELNKKKIHIFKQPIPLTLLHIDRTVISDNFKHRDGGFKYFIGYKEHNIIRLLYIILPRMIPYINYFDDDGKLCHLKLRMVMYW